MFDLPSRVQESTAALRRRSVNGWLADESCGAMLLRAFAGWLRRARRRPRYLKLLRQNQFPKARAAQEINGALVHDRKLRVTAEQCVARDDPR
jgi:hypothetical protein